MWKEFKAFVARGNLMEFAVAVIIAAAAGRMITALVDQVLMPPIGLALGGVDFKDLKYIIQQNSGSVKEVAVGYGAFLQTVIDFFIVAFVVFLMVQLYNKMTKRKKEKEGPDEQVILLSEIRDLLRLPEKNM